MIPKGVFLWLCLYCLKNGVIGIQPSLDVDRPLVIYSPTRGSTDPLYNDDRFGYAAAIHHSTANLSGLTLSQILSQVKILVGAPRGRFPGGLDSEFPEEYYTTSASACMNVNPDYLDMLSTFNESQVRKECYMRSGLVYDCSLTSTNCTAAIGNGDPNSPDGFLFKRYANRQIDIFTKESIQNARIGATLFSSGEYFVACGPSWSIDRMTTIGRLFVPGGLCVYSNRSLSDFQFLDPCSIQDGIPISGSNQAGGGFCQSGTSAFITKESMPRITVGTPGFESSTGGFGVYEDLDLPSSSTFMPKEASSLPFIGQAAASMLAYPNNSVRNTLLGFAVTVGNFTGLEEGIVTTSLRYSPETEVPGVLQYVQTLPISEGVSDTDVPGYLFNFTAPETQIGEGIGFSVIAIDLNNDGYDDLVTGAPAYSLNSKPEVGRIHIFLNTGQANGSFAYDSFVVGNSELGRFGFALTNLGDLNNDGYEDFAVSAPYENGGSVYIYYGRDQPTIVNPEAQQVIRATEMVDRVFSLESLSSFGVFLQGNTDIDDNQFRDLLIGAEDSQVVFVLRSIPVAIISLNLTTDLTTVPVTEQTCPFQGKLYSCFTIKLCATYTGRGLSVFDVNYTISEDITASQSRVILERGTGTLSFLEPNKEECDTVMAFVTVGVSGNLQDLRISAEVNQFDRPVVQVEGISDWPDLSTEPVIESSPVSTQVKLFVGCGSDDVCTSDVFLKHLSTVYISSLNGPILNEGMLTVGLVGFIELDFEYGNAGESALSLTMVFSLPLSLEIVQITSFICSPNATNSNVQVCTGFPLPLMQNESRPFTLTLRVTDDLVGDEGLLNLLFQLSITQRQENREIEVSDNSASVNIPVRAVASYDIGVNFRTSPLTYTSSNFLPVVSNTSELGEAFTLTAFFRSNGPSVIPNATLSLSLPLRFTPSVYSLYPLRVEGDSGVVCSPPIENPEGLVASTSQRRRRRKSTTFFTSTMSGFVRQLRQTGGIPVDNILDCSGFDNPSCDRIDCIVSMIEGASEKSIIISGSLDPRFFYDKVESFQFVAGAQGSVVVTYINTTGSTDTSSTTLTVQLAEEPVANPGVPLWAYIIAVIIPIIIIIVITIALYFGGCFRRRKAVLYDIKEDMPELDTFDQKAFEAEEQEKSDKSE